VPDRCEPAAQPEELMLKYGDGGRGEVVADQAQVPATPTEKFQVDGMIAKRGGHARSFVGYPLARSDLCARLCARHTTGRMGRERHRSGTLVFTG
jgi:hypothetical protein